MTLEEAKTHRARQLCGHAVHPAVLSIAISMIQKSGYKRPKTYPVVANPWGLSGCQCQILKCLAAGVGTRQFMDDTGIASTTFYSQMQRAKKKMGVKKIEEAVLMWAEYMRKTNF